MSSPPELCLQLTKVDILVSSVMCADQNVDHKFPKVLANYRTTIISFNDKICYIMCGCNLRYQKRLHGTQHIICQLHQQSPLIQLIICHSHQLIGCGQTTKAYLANIRTSGFNWINFEPMIPKFKDSYKLCPLVHLVLHNNNSA